MLHEYHLREILQYCTTQTQLKHRNTHKSYKDAAKLDDVRVSDGVEATEERVAHSNAGWQDNCSFYVHLQNNREGGACWYINTIYWLSEWVKID